MQVTVEDVSPVEKKVAVEIPWPYVAQKLDEAYRNLGKGVALKGFRKGKVPRPILERMFSRQVEQEVVKQLVQESFVHAATKHAIQPVAEPIVDDAHLHKGKSFHYSARVEVKSEVAPQDYDGIELSQRAPKVSDEDVNAAVERKRQELTQYKMIEGREPKVTQESDVLVIAFKGKIGDHELDKDGVMVDLGESAGAAGREVVPGIGKALLGLPLDATDHEVSWTIPEQEHVKKELVGQTTHLKVTIKEAREKQIPALDDELAKDTGEADTLAELLVKVREKLIEEDKERAKGELKEQLVKELLKRNSFAVAPALVERQLDNMLQRAKLQLALRGIDPRTAQLDEQRMRDDMREGANDEVRAAFLVDAIADKEKVEVAEADMEKRLAEMAQSREKSVARLKAELQKEGRLEAVRHQIREEKTLDLLLSRAKINEKAIEASSPTEK